MSILRPVIHRLALSAVLVLGFALNANATNPQSFQDMSAEILKGLDAANTTDFPASSGYGAPTIGIRSFREREVPLDVETANGYNRSLLAALQSQAGGRFRFVSREMSDKLIDDIRSSSLPQDETDRRIADLRTNSLADILISGNLSVQDGRTILSYQALSAETAHVFVTTRPIAIDEETPSVVTGNPTSLNGFSPIVVETESLLAELGYDPGPVDGHLTPETREAIKDYQLDSALPVNGRMTRRVVDNLRRDTR